MFFKKRQIPKLKQHLIDKSELVINGDGHPVAKLYTKFLLIILNEPRFGNRKKEKLKQDNDVSSFELIAYSIAKLIYYLEYNESDKKRPTVYQLNAMDKEETEKARKYDLIQLFKSLNKKLHNDYLAWENIEDLTNNRIEFYLSNSNNQNLINETLKIIIENSNEISKPIEDITTAKEKLDISSVSDSLLFTANMVGFEKDILTLVFETVSEFMNENTEIGFETKKSWFLFNG